MSLRGHRAENVDDRLDQELYALGQDLERLPARDVSAQVRRRLLQQPPVPERRQLVSMPRVLRLATALAVVVMMLGTTLALTPATRDALVRFLGLERIQIVEDDRVTGTPFQGGTSERTLAGATMLDLARHRVDFPILLPAYPEGVEQPNEVYVQELGSPLEVQLVLRYFSGRSESEVLFTLYQFRTAGEFTKVVSTGHRLQEVTVRGARGFWLEGAVHLLRYRMADGQEVTELQRQVEGNTLAWETGDITYRLETTLPLEEARRIAESLTPEP